MNAAPCRAEGYCRRLTISMSSNGETSCQTTATGWPVMKDAISGSCCPGTFWFAGLPATAGAWLSSRAGMGEGPHPPLRGFGVFSATSMTGGMRCCIRGLPEQGEDRPSVRVGRRGPGGPQGGWTSPSVLRWRRRARPATGSRQRPLARGTAGPSIALPHDTVYDAGKPGWAPFPG